MAMPMREAGWLAGWLACNAGRARARWSACLADPSHPSINPSVCMHACMYVHGPHVCLPVVKDKTDTKAKTEKKAQKDRSDAKAGHDCFSGSARSPAAASRERIASNPSRNAPFAARAVGRSSRSYRVGFPQSRKIRPILTQAGPGSGLCRRKFGRFGRFRIAASGSDRSVARQSRGLRTTLGLRQPVAWAAARAVRWRICPRL